MTTSPLSARCQAPVVLSSPGDDMTDPSYHYICAKCEKSTETYESSEPLADTQSVVKILSICCRSPLLEEPPFLSYICKKCLKKCACYDSIEKKSMLPKNAEHTLTPEQEERFEKMFSNCYPFWGFAVPSQLKQHMASEISRAREEEQKKVLKVCLSVIFDFLYRDFNNLGSVDDDDASQDLTSVMMRKIKKLLNPSTKEAA